MIKITVILIALFGYYLCLETMTPSGQGTTIKGNYSYNHSSLIEWCKKFNAWTSQEIADFDKEIKEYCNRAYATIDIDPFLST